MRTANGPAWQVGMEIPERLQFAAYIGQRQGFASPGSSTPPASSAEAEWREWWDSLIAQLEEPLPPVFDPPEFPSLAERPDLRDMCRRLWGDFKEEWRRTKILLIRQLQDQSRALGLQNIVREREKALGRPVNDFNLRLDFVRWPDDYRRDVSERHIVLGAGYLRESERSSIKAILESRIADLA